jgi:hypothetical protein
MSGTRKIKKGKPKRVGISSDGTQGKIFMKLISAKNYGHKKPVAISRYEFRAGSNGYLPRDRGSSASEHTGGMAYFWTDKQIKPILCLVFCSVVEATQKKVIFNGVETDNIGTILPGYGDYILEF